MVALITTLCWVMTSNMCFLAEVGNACELVRPSEYDYESEPVVLPRQDSQKIDNPLANAVSYLLAWLVPPVLDSIKPRQEFQDTGPPQVVSSVAISLRCCLLSNAPPA